jgi:hypothetical protein
MRHLPSAAEAAILIAVCVKRKEDEAGKEFTRLRLSEKTLARLTGRRRLDGRFIADVNEALLGFNLLLILSGDALGLVKASAIKGWPRINSQRVEDEIGAARRGSLDFDQLAEQLDEGNFPVEDEEDE